MYKNKTLGLRVYLSSAALALQLVAVSSHATEANEIVPIQKAVPASVAVFRLPDETEHFRTLEGSHFEVRCHVPYTLKTGQAAVQVCEIAPVTLQIKSWPETEVIHLIKGRVQIIEEDGTPHAYDEGDIFVLPQNFVGVWRQTEPLLKVVTRSPVYWK